MLWFLLYNIFVIVIKHINTIQYEIRKRKYNQLTSNTNIENPHRVVKIHMTDYTDLTTDDNQMFCTAAKSASIIYKNYIYIFGGIDKDGNYLDDLLQYDINLRAFTNIKVKIKPCARAGHAACLLGDYMYIHGGTDGRHSLDDLWRFDLLHGNFERITYETGRYRAPTLE